MSWERGRSRRRRCGCLCALGSGLSQDRRVRSHGRSGRLAHCMGCPRRRGRDPALGCSRQRGTASNRLRRPLNGRRQRRVPLGYSCRCRRHGGSLSGCGGRGGRSRQLGLGWGRGRNSSRSLGWHHGRGCHVRNRSAVTKPLWSRRGGRRWSLRLGWERLLILWLGYRWSGRQSRGSGDARAGRGSRQSRLTSSLICSSNRARSRPRHLSWFLGGRLGLSLGQSMCRGLRLGGACWRHLNRSRESRVPGRSRCSRC